jgi:ribonuclease E
MLDSDESNNPTTPVSSEPPVADAAGPSAAPARAPRKRVRKVAAKAAAPDAPDADPGTTDSPGALTSAATADAAVDAVVQEKPARARKSAAKAPAKAAKAVKAAKTSKPAKSPSAGVDAPAGETVTGVDGHPAEMAPAKSARRRAGKKAAPAAGAAEAATGVGPDGAEAAEPALVPAKKAGRTAARLAPAFGVGADGATPAAAEDPPSAPRRRGQRPAGVVLFQAPTETDAVASPATADAGRPGAEADDAVAADADATTDDQPEAGAGDDTAEAGETEAGRRRRRRGRRGRGARTETDETAESTDGKDDASESAGAADSEGADSEDGDGDGSEGATRRRRRRRRGGSDSAGGDAPGDDPPNTVTHVRSRRSDNDEVKGIKGSSRLEAKRQRRRDGRDSSRRRPPILTEAEFLARREAVERVMAVRQRGDRTQIAILEDDVLVEHYVTRATATSYVGNVYLGRVQNVLPSMEAAFVDIGKGRNGVLYAGEVNWDAAGLEGKARAIEAAMKPGDALLVQVTKDPIGHKGARLTSQISLPGRFLVYVPGGGMTGISRRLSDNERHRLKAILKKVVPDEAGVIVRTAAEGATEEDLIADVERLQAEWAGIQAKAAQPDKAPVLVHGEPDLAIRVVRDVFNEDFQSMVVEGDDAWQQISEYVSGVAPELAERVSRYTGTGELFHDLRVDEQLAKALDRKVWLPSGGSLVIDRTEAMTVIDVNTGKFTGSGGNLEATVTKNNLEAAEEIVRQLRLRDLGGIVVIDFIDMVLESNRDLVLRRLTECLGRDRTKHQVAEVTSLGLVQMTRKRVGEGLLEAFSEPCEVCKGRGVIVHSDPVERRGDANNGGGGGNGNGAGNGSGSGRRSRRGKGGAAARAEAEAVDPNPHETPEQRRAAAAAMAAIARADHHEHDDLDGDLLDGELPDLDDESLGIDFDADLDTDDTIGGADSLEVESDPLGEHIGDIEDIEEDVELEVTAGDTRAEPESAADVTPVDESSNDVPPAKSGRPRRRRAASRPAGPPQPLGASA